MKAIRVHEFGGSDQLRYEDAPAPKPQADEALVKLEAAGLNFIDIYHRTGAYPLQKPFIPGLEGAGVIQSVGQNVTEFAPGDRVAWTMGPNSYAEEVAVATRLLVKIPDSVGTQTAAAVMLQGLTAHFLAHSTFPLQPGHTALIHAAAGGVGLLLVQMAKKAGAWVVGTVSTEEKAKLARNAGADEVILYTQADFEEEIKRLTNGQGVHVVYDSVGKTTFDKSLNCLRPRGYMVLFGQASGAVAPIDPQILNQKGSLFLTRPTSAPYLATREELLWRANDVFGWLEAGELNVRVDTTFPLAEAKAAHDYMEGRNTKGKVLLIP
ncbi:MAG: quinone oxidoreductase [Litorilinea sp.]